MTNYQDSNEWCSFTDGEKEMLSNIVGTPREGFTGKHAHQIVLAAEDGGLAWERDECRDQFATADDAIRGYAYATYEDIIYAL